MEKSQKNRRNSWRLFFLLLAFFLFFAACGDQAESDEASRNSRSRGLTVERGIKVVGKRPAATRQERVAVVIGNSAYDSSPLKNPVNDAEAMARMLERLNFAVKLLENGSRREMFKALSEFGHKLKKADVGLFYYAGHGIQVKGRNYLVPVDARLESESDVEFEALDLGRVLGKMEDAECPLNIVILDACRDNPFARSFRSAAKGLAMVDAPRGTLLAFATAPGSVAADGDGGNGVYTRFLLENMARPGLSIEEVFKQVRIEVVNATGGRQTPWESSSLMGDFYFQRQSRNTTRKALSAGTGGASISPVASPQTTPAAPLSVSSRKSPVPSVNPRPAVKKASPPKPVQIASLPPRKPAPAAAPPRLSPEVRKYLRMVRSGIARDQRYAAKKITRNYRSNRVLLDAVRDELLKSYRHSSGDRYHVDAMAWFCNALGASGSRRYAKTLDRVAASAPSRKLKKYALKNRRKLR